MQPNFLRKSTWIGMAASAALLTGISPARRGWSESLSIRPPR